MFTLALLYVPLVCSWCYLLMLVAVGLLLVAIVYLICVDYDCYCLLPLFVLLIWGVCASAWGLPVDC